MKKKPNTHQVNTLISRIRYIWPLLLLVVLWIGFARPYLINGQLPFPSTYLVTFFPPWNASYGMPVKNNAMPDVITQIYPWKKLTATTWARGQMPLWNPYSFSGTVHAANYQTAVFSPFNLLFFVLPFMHAWSISVLLQPFFAGLFTYWFLRTIGRSKAASALGMVSFMFCGFIVVWMAYGTLANAIMWLPLLLLAIHRQLYIRARWSNGVLLSAGVVLSFTAGHFQMSLYVLLCATFYALYGVVHKRSARNFLFFSLFLLLGIALAAPQILPSLEAYGRSFRSASFVKGEVIPWSYIVTLFSPDFYGNPVTRNDWFGHYAEWASYAGVVPLLLAMYGIVSKKRNFSELFFIGIAILTVLLAYPTIFNDLLFALKIPAISTSAASRVIVLLSFSISALAASGLDFVRDDWKKVNRKTLLMTSSIATVVLVGVWIMLFSGALFPKESIVIAKRNFVLPTFFVLGGLVSLALGMIRGGKYTYVSLLLLLGLSSFEMLRFATKWIPFDPPEYVYPQEKVLTFLQKEIGNFRVYGNTGNEVATYFGIPSVEGYDALYQKRYGEFIASASNGKVNSPERSIVLLDKYGVYTENVLAMLGVRYVLHRLSDGRNVWAYPHWQYPYYKSIYRDEHYEVFENTRVLPRAFLASSYKVSKSDQDILDLLYEPTFDMRDEVVLEVVPPMEPQEGEGTVEITQYSPTRIRFSTKSDVSKLLFISDVFDPGWSATIDGHASTIYRTNYDFRSLVLPAGSHDVVMEYNPASVTVGLYAASAAMVVLVGGTLIAKRYEHRHL